MDEFQTLVFKAKEDVHRLLQGGNFSNVLGQGYDFSELRAYENSDDIRHISWINSAKSNELYVKKMYEERELLVQVAMLIDGRSIIGSKQALMTQLLATLAYSTLYSNNTFHATFILGEEFKNFEVLKSVEAVEPMLFEFNKIEPLGLALDTKSLTRKLLRVEEEKTLFFLVGDFFEEIDLSLLAQKHELCVIIVRDKWEENPNIKSNVSLLNPISNSRIPKTFSKKSLNYYKKKLEEHDAKLYAHFYEHHIKYVKIYNPSEIIGKLEGLFYF